MTKKRRKIISSLIFLSLYALSLLYFPRPLHSASDSATTNDQEGEATASSQTTQDLRERIERIVDEKREKIKGVIDEKQANRRGFIGEIIRNSQEALTIKTNKATQIIPIEEGLSLTKKQKPVALEDIAVGDWAQVIGTVEDDTFTAKSVVISSSSLRPKQRTVFLGTIKEIAKSQIVFIQRGQNTQETSLKITKDTLFQDHDGTEDKVGSFSADIQCLVLGFTDDDGTTATIIRSLAPIDEDQ